MEIVVKDKRNKGKSKGWIPFNKTIEGHIYKLKNIDGEEDNIQGEIKVQTLGITFLYMRIPYECEDRKVMMHVDGSVFLKNQEEYLYKDVTNKCKFIYTL